MDCCLPNRCDVIIVENKCRIIYAVKEGVSPIYILGHGWYDIESWKNFKRKKKLHIMILNYTPTFMNLAKKKNTGIDKIIVLKPIIFRV